MNLTPCLSAGNSAKPKLLRKKPQTITEKATAPFMPEEPASRSVLDYLGSPVQEPNGESLDEISTKAFPEASILKQKPSSKPKKRSVTLKPTAKVDKAPVLLSPKTARKTTEDQELIFGTSSQLVRDESPIFIEDMREAIEASRLMDEQKNSTLSRESIPFLSPNLFSSSGAKSSFASSRNLWSVAARDLDGSLLKVEIVDLVDTPKPCKILAPSVKPVRNGEMNYPGSALTLESKAVPDSALTKPRLENNIQTNPLKDMALEQSIPRSLAEASLRKRPRSQSPVKKQKVPKKTNETSQELRATQMPNYQGFKTAELSKAVAANGFKAIKKRTEMISLLERCWQSRNRTSPQTLAPSVSLLPELIVASDCTDEICKVASPVKKKKGRPRKISVLIPAVSGDDSTTTAQPTVNPSIQKNRGRPKKDVSMIPLSPKKTIKIRKTASPKPFHTNQVSSPSPPPSTQPLPSHLSSSTKIDPLLFQTITSAIKSFPPTHCATSLTFYEKILLYDPIVLEDLTVWLNTVGLERVGEDDEVGVKVVKEWCLAQSVCFVSREEGWRKKRKG